MLRRGLAHTVYAMLVASAPLDAAAQGPEEAVAETSAEPLLSPETLDDLVAPVALYPDALLAQIFVGATYPLDIVKADRWVEDNAALDGTARADAAEAEGWDPSVAVLAAGFPDVLGRMADDLDWTEALGDALLAQSDDVLDAVQRQRARADALGNLESNAAQEVTVEGDSISIAPADPEVVYVPAYDPDLVYTQSASAAPVIATDPADTGWSDGSMIATGVIGFGAGMLINELFDDDDDWDDYWRGPPRVNWSDGDFYPRPGRPNVDVGGDVNINVDRDGVDLDRPGAWRPDPERRDDARDRIASRDRADGGARGALAERREGAGAGGGGREALKGKIAARSGDGGAALGRGGGGKVAERKSGARDGAFAGRAEGLTGAKKAEKRGAASALRAKAGGGKAAKPAKIGKPKAGGGKVAAKKAGPKPSAFKKNKGGGAKAKAASARGGKSGGKLKKR